ncbi:hypothetical protein HMI54_002435 [Coelomomyces lativittatus]|nr:hypothetical protein HMI54_002435 [Coelomomyces lativittatus]
MVGITSNIYSRFTKNPAIAPILSGVILLVPGSLGVRSSLALIDSSSFGNGSNFAFQVILTALSLSIGILASHVVSPIEAKVTLQSQPLRNEKFNWMKKVFKIDELLKLHHPNKSPRSRLSAK